jgi:hypothetical protein
MRPCNSIIQKMLPNREDSKSDTPIGLSEPLNSRSLIALSGHPGYAPTFGAIAEEQLALG